MEILNEIKDNLRFRINNRIRKLKIRIVGSIRRCGIFRENDIDLLVLYPNDIDEEHIFNDISFPGASDRIKIEKLEGGSKHKKVHVKLHNKKYVLDLFLIPEESLPYALFHYTGPKSFNIRTRAHAKRQGYLLNQYGLYSGGNLIKVNNERELFEKIGVTYKTPKNRE